MSSATKNNPTAKTLRLILGDQLNAGHHWYKCRDDSVVYLIAELNQELNYVRHHRQKVLAFFAAMERFAEALTKAGHQVVHLTLDETCRFRDLPQLLRHQLENTGASRFEYQRPDEYRVLQQLRSMSCPAECVEVDSDHFLLPFDDIDGLFTEGKAQRMESFYRKMRKRHGILLEPDGAPRGGRWNFDKENRQKLKAEDFDRIPEPLLFDNDVGSIDKRLKSHRVSTFGDATDRLSWPITRRQARDLLAFFCDYCLPEFGRFQDAMSCQAPANWTLLHSRLSFALNAKLLHPLEVINTAIAAFESSAEIDIAQIEGFVRQILGWREFVRGIYWANMPDYVNANVLQAKTTLPDYFWDGNTRMRCLSEVIKQSLHHAYAHHIQRLMITGNFCLLAGVNPDEVESWYLGIYVDALEWVESPNTRGMSQFADGGLLASKPYCASGSYVNRMSDYCRHCDYKVSESTGDKACPFNSLYWDFLLRHRKRFEGNQRMTMMYRSWDKMDSSRQKGILKQASDYRSNVNAL